MSCKVAGNSPLVSITYEAKSTYLPPLTATCRDALAVAAGRQGPLRTDPYVYPSTVVTSYNNMSAVAAICILNGVGESVPYWAGSLLYVSGGLPLPTGVYGLELNDDGFLLCLDDSESFIVTLS